MNIRRYMRISVGIIIAVSCGLQVQAGDSNPIDMKMLQELKRMIEKQQVQIDRQAAEIAALKEQLNK